MCKLQQVPGDCEVLPGKGGMLLLSCPFLDGRLRNMMLLPCDAMGMRDICRAPSVMLFASPILFSSGRRLRVGIEEVDINQMVNLA